MEYVELRHQDERTKTYLGSPSLAILQDGALLASHDYFNGIKNMNGESSLTSIYRSEDGGRHWSQITHISGAFWMKLFTSGHSVYGIGCSQEYGDVVIRRSDDGGFTWTFPSDEDHGILLRSGPGRENPNYQTTPAPTILNGRVYLPLDDMRTEPGGPGWAARYFHTCVLSAPLDSDLLKSSSWILSNKVPFEPAKVPEPGLADANSGWLEGSIVPAPDGSLANIIRMHLQKTGKAGYLTLSADGRDLSIDYRNAIIDFLGSNSNFTIRRDPVSGLYLTLSNEIIGQYETIRNYLILAASRDLRTWRNVMPVMTDDTGFEPEQSKLFTGFQYVNWLFDGPDIIYLVRAAYRGAHNYHDSNRILFRRMQNYRQYLEEFQI